MIPKIIHYCWFGGGKLPFLAENCIKSWEKYCPDYTVIQWNETNFDYNCDTFVREAYEAKKWAFVSDYARLKIVFDNGGIYLDVDVELFRNLDELLLEKCFLAEEFTGYVNTGLGFGAEKKNKIVSELLSEYKGKNFKNSNGSYDIVTCPHKNTKPLLKYGYSFSGSKIWSNKDFKVFPPVFFCPYNYETNKVTITKDTFSIHLFNASWISILDKIIIKIEKGKTSKSKFIIKRIASLPFRVLRVLKKYVKK